MWRSKAAEAVALAPHGDEAPSRQRSCADRCAVSNHEAVRCSVHLKWSLAWNSCITNLTSNLWISGFAGAMESAYIVTSWATRPPARREQRCPTPNQETDHVRDAAVFTADAPERRTAQPHRGAADASIFRGEGVSDRLASH